MAGVVRQRFGDMGQQPAQGLKRVDPMPQALGDVQPMGGAPQGLEQEIAEALAVGEQPDVQPLEGAEVEGAPTPEQLQEWREFQDNPNIDTDKHGDKVLWYDADGKGDMRPIRLKDVPNNILMYNDYQRKTTEVAERNRQLDRRENGQKQLIADITHEDPTVGLRAWRAMMPEQQVEKMVLSYIQERAALEKLDPALQQKFLAQQKLEDENFYYKRRLERIETAQQQQAELQKQQQGAAAPDIQFVQQHIVDALPSVFQQMGIPESEHSSDAFQYELDRQFTLAASGQRNSDGTWAVAPTIQRGRAPSRQTIQQIVVAAKQSVDKLMSSTYAKRVAPPKRVAPAATFSGTGPAAAPGTRGNISAPERKRWSDMDVRPGTRNQ
jgi:hypothetical protein